MLYYDVKAKVEAGEEDKLTIQLRNKKDEVLGETTAPLPNRAQEVSNLTKS